MYHSPTGKNKKPQQKIISSTGVCTTLFPLLQHLRQLIQECLLTECIDLEEHRL